MSNFTQRLWQVYEDTAGMAAQMSRTSSPIAWLSLGLTAVRAWRVADQGPSQWSIPYRVRSALLLAAASAGLGVLRGTGENKRYVTAKGSIFQVAPWAAGPWGPDDRDIPEGLWAALGHRLAFVQVANDLSLVRDERQLFPMSRDVAEFAQDCHDLARAGARVGAICVGEPGTGKSQAVLAAAEAIGGRVLRVDLNTDPSAIHGAALVMQPNVLILDDIDRGPTGHALDVIEQLINSGVACLATCNDADAVVAAMKRHGRLDDVRFFGAASAAVRKLLVGKRKLRRYERKALKIASVAQIHRYLEVRDSLSRKRAAQWLPTKTKKPKKTVPVPRNG